MPVTLVPDENNSHFDGNDDEARVRAVLNQLDEALTTKDARLAVACYADDNVMFTLSPPLGFASHNSPGIRGVQAWLDNFDGPLRLETRELQIRVSGDLAIYGGFRRMRGTKNNGTRVDFWYRESLALAREDGGAWKIIQQHESVPFLMDGTFSAALDLKPNV